VMISSQIHDRRDFHPGPLIGGTFIPDPQYYRTTGVKRRGRKFL
jgi:hypothetical protein